MPLSTGGGYRGLQWSSATPSPRYGCVCAAALQAVDRESHLELEVHALLPEATRRAQSLVERNGSLVIEHDLPRHTAKALLDAQVSYCMH